MKRGEEKRGDEGKNRGRTNREVEVKRGGVEEAKERTELGRDKRREDRQGKKQKEKKRRE